MLPQKTFYSKISDGNCTSLVIANFLSLMAVNRRKEEVFLILCNLQFSCQMVKIAGFSITLANEINIKKRPLLIAVK